MIVHGDGPDRGGVDRRRFLTSAALLSAGAAMTPARMGWASSPQRRSFDRGCRFTRNGWVYLHIEGGPYQRGVQHGHLLAPELGTMRRALAGLTVLYTGKTWQFFVEAAKQIFLPKLPAELKREMEGIAAGARRAGLPLSLAEVATLNGYSELTGYWWPRVANKYRYLKRVPRRRGHCSAFIATGKATRGGRIVMAHNSWDDFVFGRFFNVIIDLKPRQGHRLFMQAQPGAVQSFTDYFVTSAGLIGTETTISGYDQFDEKGLPEFVRVRQAMQYADKPDDFVRIMKTKNNGGYANSWLLGDIRTGQITRFELGLKISSVQRTTSGYFIGSNFPADPRLRNLECADTGYADIRVSVGARRVRLGQLMEKYLGRIDVAVGQKVLADHYDVYLKKINPSSRTVEGHYELDNLAFFSLPGRPVPFQPRGCVDGKVTDSVLAGRMGFWARWGSSSGMPFKADRFLRRHPQWRHLRPYLTDRPTRPWTRFQAGRTKPL